MRAFLGLTSSVLIASAAVLTGPTAGAVPARPSASAPASFEAAGAAAVDVAARPTPAQRYARSAHRTTNARRADHDLPALRRDACLTKYAVAQAKRMADEQEMYHQDLHVVLEACNLTYAGENVAYGYATGRSVVNQGWMRSEGHRENILRPQYRLMALGAARGADGRWYSAQVFGRR